MSTLQSVILPESIPLATALLLIAVSFFTSALTAAFGIGGGVAMLGILSAAVPPAVIIAVHAVVQFGSNIGRTIVQRKHVLWPQFFVFSGGAIIGILIGAWLFQALPPRLLLLLLGLFILLMAWVPKPKIPGLEKQGIFIGGILASAMSMFVGAVGPFVQALLLPLGLEKRQLVATFSAMQTVQHVLKVFAFGFVGFAFTDWLPLTALMIGSGFLGTLWGTTLLEKMSAGFFNTVLKWLLTILALDLLRRAAGIELPL
jgi:uncharacterized protein